MANENDRLGRVSMIVEILDWMREMLISNLSLLPTNVLEVGSRNINGTPRTVFEQYAQSYVGIDNEPGDGVDRVIDAERTLSIFSPGHFDTIICCETLEHCIRPWKVVKQMRAVLKPGGHLWISTPTFGFPLHRYPIDCYRFGEDAYREWIYKDMHIIGMAEVKESKTGYPCLVAVGRK